MVALLSFLVLAVLAYSVYIPGIRAQTSLPPNASFGDKLYFKSKKYKKEIGLWGTLVGALLTLYAAVDQDQTQMSMAAKSDKLQQSIDSSSNAIISLQSRLLMADSLRFVQQVALTDSTAKIANLYKLLYESQKQIARLTQRASDNDTGGDSYCYVYIVPLTNTEAIVILEHAGDYPLSSLVVTIERTYDTKKETKELTLEETNQFLKEQSFRTSTFNVGTIAANQNRGYNVGRIPFIPGKNEDYRIDFYAKNGYWSQEYRFRYNAKGERSESFTVKRSTGKSGLRILKKYP